MKIFYNFCKCTKAAGSFFFFLGGKFKAAGSVTSLKISMLLRNPLVNFELFFYILVSYLQNLYQIKKKK